MRSETLNFADWQAIFWHSFWHIFWHYFWHIFWHSFWHIFWHSFWHIFWHILWHSFWHIFWNSFWHIFWHSFWHIVGHSFDILSDISCDILSDISFDILSDISLDILSDISSDILSGISFVILSDISSDILSDISFDMLCDTSFDILSDIRSLTFLLTILATNCLSKTKHSIHSFTQKPLHKLYIYRTPRSKSNIHDDFASVKSSLHRTAPPRSSWVPRCKAPVATHKPHASDSPAKKAVESQDAMQVSTQPQLHLMARANHEVRCLPLCLLHLFGVTAQHWFATHALQHPKRMPKFERLQHAAPTLACPPHLEHLSLHKPHSSIHNFWHNEHTIPSMRSRIHAHVDALRSNCSQDIAPHIPNSLCKPAGRANEDCRRTFHHKLRHGCQTKLTCLHAKSWATSVCGSAPHQMTQH